MTADVYVVATSAAPDIKCPDWCERGETHLNDLVGLEGRVIHSGPGHIIPISRNGHQLVEIRVARVDLADGTPDPDDGKPVLNIEGREVTLDEAREIGMCLLDLVKDLS